MTELKAEDGRRAFGADAGNYDAARPEYPGEIYTLLRQRCGLGPGTRCFEVGPGTGLATRRLIEAGAKVTGIEPDARLADVLKRRSPETTIINATFEEAVVGETGFDLGASATAFHWVHQRNGLAKAASLLKRGGWWAMWWNVFGDHTRADPFHDATQPLLSSLATTPSWNPSWKHPFALDTEARFADIASVAAFEGAQVEVFRWTLTLDATAVRALYATYSHINILADDERARILDGLAEVADKEFGGRVERHMVTPIYTARRR